MPGRPGDTIARIAGEIAADAIVVGARRSGRFSSVLRSLSRNRLPVSGVPVVTVFDSAVCPSEAGASAIARTTRSAPIPRA